MLDIQQCSRETWEVEREVNSEANQHLEKAAGKRLKQWHNIGKAKQK